jgi:hypothetical protein
MFTDAYRWSCAANLQQRMEAGPLTWGGGGTIAAPGRSYRTNHIAVDNYCSDLTPPRRVRPPGTQFTPYPRSHLILHTLHHSRILKQAEEGLLGQPPLPGQRFVDRDVT